MNRSAQKALAARAKGAPYFGTPLAPTTAYVIVLRVDFSDKAMSKSKTETEQFFETMKQFYHENSYGLFTVSATVTSQVYRMPRTLAAYAQGICSEYSRIAHDAAGTASNVDFAAGASGGRRFDHLMIYHAGAGAETSGDGGCQTDNIWSVFAPTVPATADLTEGVTVPFTPDGVAFNGTTLVPESESGGIDPTGVICHEYGHQLGLPDLYRTSAQSVVGKWSLMDSGIYLGSPAGSNPAHLDAWSKQFLGFFSNPQTVAAGEVAQSATMELALSSANAYLRVPVSGIAGVDGNREYFLIEKRARSSVTGRAFDDALPFGTLTGGYLIWHVDDSIASSESRLAENSVNSGSPNFGVDLVEADGGGAITGTAGKESDPFPGSAGHTLFATPLSNAFNGQTSAILVSGFSGPKLIIRKALALDSLEISKTVNFPNPGGPGYAQKSGAPGGTVTTIVASLTRPPQKLLLSIHDLSGALVRSAQSAEIKANGLATETHKFVYEYDWDGRNDAGETVAPGVYLYRFRADSDAVKTGKLVLVR